MGGGPAGNAEKTERIKNLVQLVRETETPGRHAESFCYSRAVYTAFREITALRDEGFSMAAICRVMARDGLLPEAASLNSFRRAFRRETARRERAAQSGEVKQGRQEPAAPVRPVPKLAAQIVEKNPSSEEAERVRRLIAGSAATGSGSIRKLPNGEFEF